MRLTERFTSGFVTTQIDLYYKGDHKKRLCAYDEVLDDVDKNGNAIVGSGRPGNYEVFFSRRTFGRVYSLIIIAPVQLWWVKRTRYNFIVEKKKRFRVIGPRCSFDVVNNRIFPFAEIID